MIDLQATFEKFKDEHGKFGMIKIKDTPSGRPDLCAFLLLDKLIPNDGIDMISDANLGLIFLGVDCKKLAEVATNRDILTLVRCGVIYDSKTNSLMKTV